MSSLSLVRYKGNDYSVPVAFGHREVLIRGYVDEVVISCGAHEIARHKRSWEKADFIFNPLHYLALIERKTNALDQTAPLQNGFGAWIPIFRVRLSDTSDSFQFFSSSGCFDTVQTQRCLPS